MRASDYRAEARLALKGKWGAMALLELIATAVCGVLASIFAIALVLGPLTVSAIHGLDRMLNGASVASDELSRIPASFFVLLAIGILLVGATLSLLTAGLYRASCAAARGRTPHPVMLFPLELLPRAVAMNFVRAAIVGVGTLLLVIPGLIAAYRYAMADYLLVTRRRMGPMEALRTSAAYMKGRKHKLFFVQLNLLILFVLSALPLVIVQVRIHELIMNGTPSSLSLLTAPLALLAAVAWLFLAIYLRVASTIFFREADREESRRAKGELDEAEDSAAAEGEGKGFGKLFRFLKKDRAAGEAAPEAEASEEAAPEETASEAAEEDSDAAEPVSGEEPAGEAESEAEASEEAEGEGQDSEEAEPSGEPNAEASGEEAPEEAFAEVEPSGEPGEVSGEEAPVEMDSEEEVPGAETPEERAPGDSE